MSLVDVHDISIQISKRYKPMQFGHFIMLDCVPLKSSLTKILPFTQSETFLFLLQSLGCLLFAMCFFKTPFDAVHERGDSVALAVIGGRIVFPDNHPYSQVWTAFWKYNILHNVGIPWLI